MDEHAEARLELAALERDHADELRQDTEAHEYEAAMDVFMAGCFLRVNDE